MSVLSASSWHVRSCLCSAPFYQYTSCQLLISCYQNLLAKSSFGCNYSSSSCCDVGAVFDTYNQETAIDLKGRWVSSQPVKEKHHLKHGKVCGEAVSFTGTVTVKKPATSTRHAAFLQVSIMTFSRSSESRNAGWEEFMAIPCYSFFLSKPPIANHSETFSCTWWGTSRYPAVSLGPGTWDCTVNKDLLLPSIC